MIKTVRCTFGLLLFFCFRSKRHQFHKASTTADKMELSQRSNAIDNPTYVAIEGIMDEDVHAKIQDGEGIKTETQGATTVEPVTKVDEDTQDSTNSKDEGVSDSAVNGMSEDEPAPNINVTEGMTHTLYVAIICVHRAYGYPLR